MGIDLILTNGTQGEVDFPLYSESDVGKETAIYLQLDDIHEDEK